jgi:hypothetical protein
MIEDIISLMHVDHLMLRRLWSRILVETLLKIRPSTPHLETLLHPFIMLWHAPLFCNTDYPVVGFFVSHNCLRSWTIAQHAKKPKKLSKVNAEAVLHLASTIRQWRVSHRRW